MASIAELGYASEDADRFSLFDPSIPETQSVPHRKPTIHLETLKSTFENINEHLPFESQKQAPVKFDPSPMLQNFDLLAVRSVFVAKAGGSSRPLVTVVEALVEIVSKNVDQLADSLTIDDCQRLAAAREKLIDTVGEDENHFLTLLIDFITNLIKNHEEESNSLNEKQHRSARRKRKTSAANRPRVKLTDLLPQDTQNVNTSSLKPRRPEHVGRPVNRPRVKLSDLLSREAEHIATREADHEMQMDDEV
ncbi:hypothetical protein F4Y43_00880 [Candidatus Poribacteria bacterium]|nr:hypothetical protein [Candidatus Poribacteria bacterium]